MKFKKILTLTRDEMMKPSMLFFCSCCWLFYNTGNNTVSKKVHFKYLKNVLNNFVLIFWVFSLVIFSRVFSSQRTKFSYYSILFVIIDRHVPIVIAPYISHFICDIEKYLLFAWTLKATMKVRLEVGMPIWIHRLRIGF